MAVTQYKRLLGFDAHHVPTNYRTVQLYPADIILTPSSNMYSYMVASGDNLLPSSIGTYDNPSHKSFTLTNGNYVTVAWGNADPPTRPYAYHSLSLYKSNGTLIASDYSTDLVDVPVDYLSIGISYDESTDKYYMFTYTGYFNYNSGLRTDIVSTEFTAYSQQIGEWLGDSVSENPDPFDEPGSGGNTDPGEGGGGNAGGNGDHNNDSDDIGEPADPGITAVATGFVRLYTPSISNMNSLASYLWSNNFDVDNFKKLFQNPMEAILGFSALPFQISAGSSQSVKLGNIDTGVSMPVVANQYKTIDCGSISIGEYWGSYLDYNPHTQIDIFLPYVGTHQLDTDEVMGHTVSVSYKIDVLTGGCIAFVKVDGSVRYQFSGSCAVQLPINALNFNSVITGAISIGVASIGAIASGGLSAPVSAGLMAGTIASTANNVTSMKTHVEKSGAIGGSAGIMGVQKPYITIKRPNPCIPYGQNEVQGYPSFTYVSLGSLSGFTRVSDIFLDNVDATDAEKDEIMSLLKGGVIL